MQKWLTSKQAIRALSRQFTPGSRPFTGQALGAAVEILAEANEIQPCFKGGPDGRMGIYLVEKGMEGQTGEYLIKSNGMVEGIRLSGPYTQRLPYGSPRTVVGYALIRHEIFLVGASRTYRDQVVTIRSTFEECLVFLQLASEQLDGDYAWWSIVTFSNDPGIVEGARVVAQFNWAGFRLKFGEVNRETVKNRRGEVAENAATYTGISLNPIFSQINGYSEITSATDLIL